MTTSFESMLRWSAWLIAGGLVVQLVTCFWVSALSFVVFLAVGGALTGAGVLVFLYWLATRGPEQRGSRQERPV
jgi:hypothetical protein